MAFREPEVTGNLGERSAENEIPSALALKGLIDEKRKTGGGGGGRRTDGGEQHVVQQQRDGHDDENELARAPASLQELGRFGAEQTHRRFGWTLRNCLLFFLLLLLLLLLLCLRL